MNEKRKQLAKILKKHKPKGIENQEVWSALVDDSMNAMNWMDDLQRKCGNAATEAIEKILLRNCRIFQVGEKVRYKLHVGGSKEVEILDVHFEDVKTSGMETTHRTLALNIDYGDE